MRRKPRPDERGSEPNTVAVITGSTRASGSTCTPSGSSSRRRVVATVDGEARRLPTVLVVRVQDGKITDVDEYADSVTAQTFREALAN